MAERGTLNLSQGECSSFIIHASAFPQATHKLPPSHLRATDVRPSSSLQARGWPGGPLHFGSSSVAIPFHIRYPSVTRRLRIRHIPLPATGALSPQDASTHLTVSAFDRADTDAFLLN